VNPTENLFSFLQRPREAAPAFLAVGGLLRLYGALLGAIEKGCRWCRAS